MKKIKIFCLSLLTLLLATLGFACIKTREPSQYTLKVFDPHGYIVTELDEKYRAGEEINVIVRDEYSGIRVELYINDDSVVDYRALEHPYVLFSFTMPRRNSTLYVSPPYYPDNDETPPIISSSSSLPTEVNAATFTVRYDYGTHVQTSEGVPMATMLLDYNSFFFDPQEWNVEMPLLAGDALTVYYTGEMYVEEVYPGQVVIEDGSIQGVKKTKYAYLRALKYENETVFVDGVCVMEMPDYAVNIDGTLCPINEAISLLKQGGTLYASYVTPSYGVYDDEAQGCAAELAGIALSAVYTYNPEYPVPASKLTPWINYLQAENVASLKVRSYNGSVGPNGFIETKVTTDQTEIGKMLDHLKKLTYKQVSAEEAMICGGYTVEYTFTNTLGQTYGYSRYAGYYNQGEKYYKPSTSEPQLVWEKEYYSFQYYQFDVDLYVNGEYAKTYDNFLPEIDFVYTDEIPEYPPKKYVIYHDGPDIYILNEKYFYFEGREVVCKIVGEKDFSEIFAEYPPDGGTEGNETYSLAVEGATGLLTSELLAKYAAGEKVTFTTKVLIDACIAAYLNGEYIGLGNDMETEEGTRWVYSFTMPAKDSILRVQAEEGFLPEVESVTFSAQYIRASTMINQTHIERISSAEQLVAYKESQRDEYGGFDSVLSACEKYDKEYFAQKSLLIVSLEENSSSITHEIKNIEITRGESGKNTVTVTIERILPEEGYGDCAMQPWYILIEVPKYNRIESGNLQVKWI